MVVEPVDDDPDLQYSDLEEQALSRNLALLTQQVQRVDSQTELYTVGLICNWHRRLFDGVRGHAGQYRSPDFGAEYLRFGPHRSMARVEVPNALERHIQMANGLLRQLIDQDNQVNQFKFVRSVLTASLYIHAELIRIHPFMDGNGRVARLCISFFLRRFGLPPVVFEIPKNEYIDRLNHYYTNGDIEPLVKLVLRIYSNQLLRP